MVSSKTYKIQRTQGVPTRHWIIGFNYGQAGGVMARSHRPGYIVKSFDGKRKYKVQPAGNIVRM